ncbi:hypothetical protein GBA52_008523 [Prunus armeniaca]|nr:hypothetical protein GBA52_008523 [Prunus armeniaca]
MDLEKFLYGEDFPFNAQNLENANKVLNQNMCLEAKIKVTESSAGDLLLIGSIAFLWGHELLISQGYLLGPVAWTR